jgi:hypothetical protein
VEILQWLRDQWAGIFADMIRNKTTSVRLKGLEDQIKELSNVVSSLKTYSEEIVKSVSMEQSSQIIQRVNEDLLNRMISDLSNENLVEFVGNFAMKDRGRPTKARIAELLIKSESFENFIDSVSADEYDRITLKDILPAREDYNKIRARLERMVAGLKSS